jgi:hypothetical protein
MIFGAPTMIGAEGDVPIGGIVSQSLEPDSVIARIDETNPR